MLKTHRRKAFLLSLGPATILKFITIMLPIIKFLPPAIKAIKALSTFASSGGSRSGRNSGDNAGGNAVANREANAAAATEGMGMSMDELNEILWTPAEDTYWERVHAMVTRFGLCKTLGVSLAGVRPGRVELTMPFRAEISGEGGGFHASLLPTLIAMTSQLTGTTLLPRHFTLKPIDFKCNILSDCDPSTHLLVSRGAVVVRGDHSITVKVEIMKASGPVSGSTEVVTTPSAIHRSPSSGFSWKSRSGSPSTTTPTSPSSNTGPSVLIPGMGIERNKFVVCATGMQTSVVVRAGTDQNNEEENEIQRLKRERQLRSQRSFSSSTSSSFSYDVDGEDSAVILGDSFRPLHSSRPMSPTTPRDLQRSQHPYHHQQQSSSLSLDNGSYEAISPSTSFVAESQNTHHPLLSRTSTATVIPMSYASAVRYGTETHDSHQHVHPYEEASDTDVWKT